MDEKDGKYSFPEPARADQSAKHSFREPYGRMNGHVNMHLSLASFNFGCFFSFAASNSASSACNTSQHIEPNIDRRREIMPFVSEMRH